ncbi:hypothetical protein DXT95_25510 [Agrobacterium tumefaciens]|nr:hypothetical protein [Agrobacterium tumefaciens]
MVMFLFGQSFVGSCRLVNPALSRGPADAHPRGGESLFSPRLAGYRLKAGMTGGVGCLAFRGSVQAA